MVLSDNFLNALPKSITPDITKHFVIFHEISGKKACFSGKRVQLLSFNPNWGSNFTEITEEEAKLKHLGKMRCIGIINAEQELMNLFSKYFNFEIPDTYHPPVISIKTTMQREKKLKTSLPKKEKKKLDLRVNEEPQDRDERQLVESFRNAQTQREKNKIFNVILYQRGVHGKTWDQIIQSFVHFNRHKFSQFRDRTENDFYQDIISALYTQVNKWFDVRLSTCFSTYAWFVINCAFKRVLQSLSTQKRKISSVKSVELDDPECSWDEVISSEKTLIPQTNFEDDYVKRELCNHINKMFELKTIDAPEELKEAMLKVIQNKSTMQNSFYALAKQYGMSTEQIFILEKNLRDNLRNSMYRDILRNIKYDINGDDDIAKKYRRSKGHVIKMKRLVVSLVKSKLEESD